MADILIRGMEMPQENEILVFDEWHEKVYARSTANIGTRRYEIVPLPEGHGDLIDRDDVLLRVDCIGTNKFGMLDEDIRAFLKQFKPIVPAEGGTSE